MTSPSFIIRSSCGSLSTEVVGGDSATVEPVIRFPVLEVLPCCWAVTADNENKDIIKNTIMDQSKQCLSFRKLKPSRLSQLLFSLFLFHCLQLFYELSWQCRSSPASCFFRFNLIAFSGHNCPSEVLICITGADGCFLCRPQLVIVLFGFPLHSY